MLENLSSYFSEWSIGFIACAVIVAVLLSLFLFIKFDAKSRSCSIPGMEPTDTIKGNLGDLSDAGSLHEFLVELHKKYGPLASFWWGQTFVVSFGSPELFNEVKDVFDRPRVLFEAFSILIGNKSIQYANGPGGFKKHQLLGQTFRHDVIANYFEHFINISKEIVDQWSSLPADEHIPLCTSMIDMSVEIAILSILGEQITKEEVKQFRKAYYTCWDEVENQLKGSMPEDGDGRLEEFNKHRSILLGLITTNIAKRREDQNKKHYICVDALDDADYLDKDEFLEYTVSTTIASFHTTGLLLTWCFYYLAKHLDVQEKVYQEMVTVMDEETITNEITSELTYTRQVVDESLRCSVLAPWAARFSDHDLKINEYVIPKETPIILPLGVLLKDEKIWPDPERFDPERFNVENSKRRHPMAFQPFGFAGKRKCLGYRFAYAETFAVLSIFLRRFKIHVDEGLTVKPHYALVTRPDGEIWITVAER